MDTEGGVMNKPLKIELLVMVGALAGAMALCVGHARADDAVSTASQPHIASIVPNEKNVHDGGRIGVGERLREQGYSARKDLLRKRTPRDIISGGHGGTEGGGIGDAETGKPLETIDGSFDTQPISIGYRPTGNGPTPVAPEPGSLALMGIGLASWILCNRRGKH
jgi:PEP-CTERM motif-containing protein